MPTFRARNHGSSFYVLPSCSRKVCPGPQTWRHTFVVTRYIRLGTQKRGILLLLFNAFLLCFYAIFSLTSVTLSFRIFLDELGCFWVLWGAPVMLANAQFVASRVANVFCLRR